MDEAAFKEGRTILFVSHNMTSVRNLCTRAVLIRQGNLVADGPSADIVDQYLEEGSSQTGRIPAAERTGSGRLRVTAVDFESPEGGRIEELPVGQPVVVRVRYAADGLNPSDSVVAGLGVVGSEDALFNNYSNYSGKVFRNLPPIGSLVFEWPSVDLVPGPYQLVIRIVANGDHHVGEVLDMTPPIAFHVAPADFYGSGKNLGMGFGVMLVRGAWNLEV